MVPTLETERLVLEKIGKQHASDRYVSWMNDEEVYKYLETGGNYTRNELEAYLEKAESEANLLFWAIKVKEEKLHIGNIKIDPVNKKHGFAEYGIMIGDRKNWGKGYAIEASEVVIDYCFQQLGLRKINLGVVADNEKAVELYKRMGFELEGTYRYHGFYQGKYCDCHRMAIFNPDFKVLMNEG